MKCYTDLWMIFALFVTVISIGKGEELTNTEDVKKLGTHNKVTQLKRIYSLQNHCRNKVCRNFHFDNISEVAFFDLKAKVQINNGASTYNYDNAEEFESLAFVDSTFANFPLQLFYALGIKDLDIRNCSIQTVTWESFLMAGEIRILILSNNLISEVEALTFNYAAQLQYLFLDSNRLSSLVSESFRGLGKLRYLDLKQNQLRILPEGIFDYLTELKELHLAENKLGYISVDLFNQIPALITLTLNDNDIEALEEYTFRNLAQLQLLDISNNIYMEKLVLNLNTKNLRALNCSLHRVNLYGTVVTANLENNKILELYFAQPEALQMLNLRNNKLEQISSLVSAVNLEYLILSDNPGLHNIPESWMMDNSLERLDLSNINMKYLPINTLAAQSQLYHLNVSHNKLTEINPINFKYLQNLTHFYIHGNNWNCYNLKSLMDMLIKPYSMTYSRDEIDDNFPGEYIEGIACMYRLEEEEEEENDDSATETNQSRSEKLVQENSEIIELRREIKALVGIYDQKFDQLYAKIDDLNARLMEFERINKTMWEYVTISMR